MKILAVRLQNLHSLKGRHEIRFDQSPLADAGLFAITGQTGSGKTTILDAITVGLYGLVHRHSNDKPLELMTRHTAESYAEVEFEAEGTCYRSKWQIRRSRGKAEGKMQAVHMELCVLGEEKPLDLKPSQVPEKVAELCGLDYSQFLRSVMLSQGDFARFLKASPNERSSLLEKITDTGIYSDISRFAYEKAKTERMKREELERRLQDTQLLPEEQRQAYDAQIIELAEQEAALQQKVKTVQEQLQWLQRIQQLQEKEQVQQAALHMQEEKLFQLKPDFERLQQHEQARQYEGQLTRIEVTHGHVVQVQAQLNTLVEQLPKLEAELEAAGLTAAEAGKAHHQQEEALRKLEPLLEQVVQMDHQLSTARDRYLKSKTDYLQFEKALKQETTSLSSKKEELTQLTKNAHALKGWLQQNQRTQDLQEHLPEFRQTLKDLAQAEAAIKRQEQEQQEFQSLLSKEAQQKKELLRQQEEYDLLQKNLEREKQEKIERLQLMLAEKKIEELESLAQEQPQLLARYERLLELSQNHAAQRQKQQQTRRQLMALAGAVATQQALLQKKKEACALATEKLGDLQKLVALQLRLQEYEQARHSLQQDEPCPLCGSLHHPYAAGDFVPNLSEEEQRRDRQLALVKELEENLNSLQLHLHTLQHQQKATSQAETEVAAEIERLQLVYGQQAQQISIPITASDKLAESLLHEREALGNLNKNLQQARLLSREAEDARQRLQTLRENQLQAQGQLSKLEHSEKMQRGQLQKLQEHLQDLHEQRKAGIETAASFAATYAFIYQDEKRQELLEVLGAQVNEYQRQQKTYDGLREPFLTLQEQVKSLALQVAQKEKELKERQESLKEEYNALTQLKEVRAQLFGEKDPQQERQRAQQELKVRAKQAEAARAAHQQKQQQLYESRQREQECQASHRQSKSVLDELRDGLLRLLQQQGIQTIEALTQMLLDKDEATRLANLKAQTEKHLTELRKSLADIQHELLQTRRQELTAAGQEELRATYSAQTQQHRELIAQKARYQQLLEQDEQQREKNRDLAEQLQTQRLVCNRWDQLAHLIGSSDGNRFSRFAQGLTLARLVELANRHLQKLNDRYRILKSSEEDLELLIVDTYQAEAVRPMNTLSGGESFLVSLALALGLSDLAGRRTQINSLFIDEGFGTLDAETLDAVISTLENLQASGKMIGIISHVEALKERISTQIRVQKQAGGISKVEVVGL